MDDIHTLDTGLGAISVDKGPNLPLGLDTLSLLAHPSVLQLRPVPRPPSPSRRAQVCPLPKPQADGKETASPLGGLFDIPELQSSVLEGFDQPRDLAVLARVNKAFCKLARRKLYSHVWIRPCAFHTHWPRLALGLIQSRGEELSCQGESHTEIHGIPF